MDINEVKRTCSECGCIIENDSECCENMDGELICEDCYNDNYFTCDHCNNIYPSDDAISIDDGIEYVCSNCAETYYILCDCCDHYYSMRHIWAQDDIRAVCDNCSSDYYLCEDCGAILYIDNVHEIDGYYYCDDCIDSHTNCIHDYGYKPEPIFYGSSNMGYGIELEIDDGEDREQTAADICAVGNDDDERIYIKHDGSLNEDGLEIVTHPMTLLYHMDVMPWTAICNTALQHDYKSHDTNTCGLHVHASRLIFGTDEKTQDLNIAKIMLLVDKWWDAYIVPFSRRDIRCLERWANKPNADIQPEDDENIVISKARYTKNYGRYQAINLKNWATVEFRLFRGTLKATTILATIQWIDTLIQYVKKTRLKDLWTANWNDIFGHTGYAELTEYLISKNLLKKEGKTQCA